MVTMIEFWKEMMVVYVVQSITVFYLVFELY